MKRKWIALSLSLLLALQLCAPAFAAEDGAPDAPAQSTTEQTAPDTPEADAPETTAPDTPEAPTEAPTAPEAPEAEEAAAPTDGEIYTASYEPEPGKPVLIQCGAISGHQTILGEPTLMDSAETMLYNRILDNLQSVSSSFDISDLGMDSDSTWQIYLKVIDEHPELFYCKGGYGYSYNSVGAVVTIRPHYLEDLSAPAVRDAFTAKVNEALAQIKGITDPVEELLILHDYLVQNCKYNYEVEHDLPAPTQNVYSAYGALVDGDAVCQGYALAYQVLANKAGINCVYISSRNMNHGWNLVQLNGNWYHVDVTWDDPTPNSEGRCSHNYFLRTDDEMDDHIRGEKDWNQNIQCNDSTYSSGWIFNNTVSSIYKNNNQYYYVTASRRGNTITGMTLRQASVLNTTGTSKLSFRSSCYPNPMSGMMWHNDILYYVVWGSGTGTQYIMAVPLDEPKLIQAGTFDLSTTCQHIGLRAEGNDIIATNSITRTQAGTGTLLSSFGTIGTNDIVLSNDKKSALVKRSAVTSRNTLWVASYNDNRMNVVQQLSFPEHVLSSADYALVPLETALTGSTVKAFSLDSNFVPDAQPSASAA